MVVVYVDNGTFICANSEFSVNVTKLVYTKMQGGEDANQATL